MPTDEQLIDAIRKEWLKTWFLWWQLWNWDELNLSHPLHIAATHISARVCGIGGGVPLELQDEAWKHLLSKKQP